MKNLKFIIILLVLGSCKSTEKASTQADQPQQQMPLQQTQVQTVSTASCDEFVKKNPDLKIVTPTPEGAVQFTTDSNRIVDETTFSKWLGDCARQIFSSACVYKKISVSATLAAGYYLEASFARSDYDLFKQGQISEAEWLRRFDVKRVETTAYLLQSLKEARSKAEHTQALALIDRILEKEPQNYNVLLIKANVLLDQKLSADAALLYQSVLTTQPNSLIALFNLGIAQKELGSFSEAIATFERLLNRTPTNTSAVTPFTQDQIILQLVDATLKNNDLERTGRYLAQLKDTVALEASVLKAQFLRMQGKYTEAKDVFQGLVDRAGVPAYVLFNLTLAYLDLKDAANAQIAFGKLKAADAALSKELEFLQPFRTPSTHVVTDPNMTQPTTQQAPDVVDDDTDYAEQPAETDEGEQKF